MHVALLYHPCFIADACFRSVCRRRKNHPATTQPRRGAPPNSVKWFATQLLAAASICGLLAAMLPPSTDKSTAGFEQVIAEAGRATTAYLNDAERQQLMTMFRLALTDTDRQMVMAEDGTAYVKTGDIPAEWLRDSSAQVRPLLYFAYENKAIANTVKAVIERQAMYVALDPYANAFRDDFTVWERKFELDSLSFPILLVWTYWKVKVTIRFLHLPSNWHSAARWRRCLPNRITMASCRAINAPDITSSPTRNHRGKCRSATPA